MRRGQPGCPQAAATAGGVGAQVRPQEGSPGGAAPLEAVVVRPSSAPGPLPAVVLPHGGPHAAYTRSYMLPTAFLPALGYAVIAVRLRHLPFPSLQPQLTLAQTLTRIEFSDQ